jgi:hypothetical protein
VLIKYFTFQGWSTASDGSILTDFTPVTQLNRYKLYAIWQDNSPAVDPGNSGGNSGGSNNNDNGGRVDRTILRENNPAPKVELTERENLLIAPVKNFAEIISNISNADKPLSNAIVSRLAVDIKAKIDTVPTDLISWVKKLDVKTSADLLTSIANPANQAISIVLNDQLRETIGADAFKEIFANSTTLDTATLNKIFLEKFGFTLDDWMTGIGLPFLMQLMLQ